MATHLNLHARVTERFRGKQQGTFAGRSEVRRCRDCRIKIEHRGYKSVRCEECAHVHAIRWRRAYDAKPANVSKRRAYDARPVNVTKARLRRNKKTYFMELCFKALRLEGTTFDTAIQALEKKISSGNRERPQLRKSLRARFKGKWTFPWATLRGKNKRARRRAIAGHAR